MAAATAAVAGSAQTGGAVGGHSGTDWEPPSDEPIDRERMDPVYIDPDDGEDLAEYAENSGPGELLVVAPGDYRWTRQVTHDWDDWGIQGDPDAGGAVTVWLEDGWGFYEERVFPDSLGLLINSNGGTNLLVENLHLNSMGRTSPGFRFVPSDGGVLVHRLFDHAPGTTRADVGGTYTFLLGIGADAHVMVDGACQHQRANISYDNSSQGFLWNAGPGELTVRRCKASGMADNLVYTRMAGPMTVEDCVFANTTPSSIRLGGDNELVRDCTFWLDTDGRELHNLDGVVNTRGIGLDGGGNASDGGHIEGCSFICEHTPFASGLIATILPNARLNVRDSQFLLNQPTIDGIFTPGATVTLEDSEFVTTSDAGATVGAAGTFETSNVGIDPGLDPGGIEPDYADVAFEWDRAAPFPDPQLANAFVPVGEERPGRGAHHHGLRTPPWVA